MYSLHAHLLLFAQPHCSTDEFSVSKLRNIMCCHNAWLFSDIRLDMRMLRPSTIFWHRLQVTDSTYPTCISSVCGSTELPPRGYCSMGSCQCLPPWWSNDCRSLGLAPSIVRVATVTLAEGQPLELTLNISQVIMTS